MHWREFVHVCAVGALLSPTLANPVSAQKPKTDFPVNNVRRVIGSFYWQKDPYHIMTATPPYRLVTIKSPNGHPLGVMPPWNAFSVFDSVADGHKILILTESDPDGRGLRKILDVAFVGDGDLFGPTECQLKEGNADPVFAVGKRKTEKNIERLTSKKMSWSIDVEFRKFKAIDPKNVDCEINLDEYD